MKRRKTTTNSVFFSFVFDDLSVSLWVIMGEKVYFVTQAVVFSLYLFTLYISLRMYKVKYLPEYMKYFYLYPLVGSLIMLMIVINTYKPIPHNIAHDINALSVLFHFIFLSRFIYLACAKKKLIIILCLFFFVIIIFFVIYDLINNSYYSISFSNASLFVLCIFYFYYLFISSPVIYLLKEPTFWVCCGIFLGSGILIPAPALMKYITIHFDELKYFNVVFGYLGFAIMYLFFIKAILCLPILRK
jgi:hypothetical protein